MSEQQADTARWSPWWAVALTLVAMIPPAGVLLVGFQQLSLGLSGGYMSELAIVVGPMLIALGLMLLVPGVLYLVLRRRFPFYVALVAALIVIVLAII